MRSGGVSLAGAPAHVMAETSELADVRAEVAATLEAARQRLAEGGDLSAKRRSFLEGKIEGLADALAVMPAEGARS